MRCDIQNVLVALYGELGNAAVNLAEVVMVRTD